MRLDAARLIALVATVACAVLVAGAASPTAARADVCDKIPSIPGVPNPVKTGCDVAGKVPEVVTDPSKAVTDIATAPLNAAGDAVMQGVTKWVADGAGWLIGQAGKLIDATTTPRLDSPWFAQQIRRWRRWPPCSRCRCCSCRCCSRCCGATLRSSCVRRSCTCPQRSS